MSSDTCETTPLVSSKPVRKRQFTTLGRLFLFAVIGSILIATWFLVFLQRTSPSRDYNRIHFSQLSKSDRETLLLRSISNDSIAKWSYGYTQEPHLAGTNYELVQWTADEWEEAGFKTEIGTYEVLLNYPVDNALKLINKKDKVVFEAKLEEDVLKEDPTTGLPDRVPVFHGYSATGNVTAHYIYGHYCTREDFLALDDLKVEIEGKIVICRYGRNFRGVKVQGAQERGAVGVVMYSDPGDDMGITVENGYKAYPDGPARNPSAVQRGSVQFLADVPGDPTTPGWASVPGAKRVEPETIPKIPSLPISYSDALPLLTTLNGKGPSLGWSGGLKKFNYSVGPSDYKLNLYNLQDYAIRPVWNVYGKIEGILKDEIVFIGNHRDAWIAGGASDPNSGSACLMEVAKGFGKLLQEGYQPLRTIVIASWDGEEYGLLGSTEFGEDKAGAIGAHVVAYINLDDATSGNQVFSASASPLLYNTLKSTSKDIHFNGTSLYEFWKSTRGAHIGDLGSGSDFTVFQHHLGVPSMDFSFHGDKNSAVYQYHSNYDSYHWMETYGDPEFLAHETIAKLLGLLTLNIADSPVLELRASDYPSRILLALKDLEGEALSSSSLDLTAMTELFTEVKEATLELKLNAEEFDANAEDLADQYTTDFPWYDLWKKWAIMAKIKVSNAKMNRVERVFLHKDGLDGRPWFKSIMFAPNRYSGYSSTPLPGLKEALEDNNFEALTKWSAIYKAKIQAAAGILKVN